MTTPHQLCASLSREYNLQSPPVPSSFLFPNGKLTPRWGWYCQLGGAKLAPAPEPTSWTEEPGKEKMILLCQKSLFVMDSKHRGWRLVTVQYAYRIGQRLRKPPMIGQMFSVANEFPFCASLLQRERFNEGVNRPGQSLCFGCQSLESTGGVGREEVMLHKPHWDVPALLRKAPHESRLSMTPLWEYWT